MSNGIALLENHTAEDFLDRREFVEQMFAISQYLANNKETACYALNGEWGIGKTFVLDMFQERVESQSLTEDALNRCVVFRYNCWEYDYYEEPLVAIVAAMLNKLDSLRFLSTEEKNTIVGILKRVGNALVDHSVKWAEKKLDLNEGQIQEFVAAIIDGVEESQTSNNKMKEFDQNFSFSEALNGLKKQIKGLSEKRPVIFLVDELDRCLPEYTIRVLERLHHLFEGIANVQIVLAVDRKQLEHTIRQIYGPDTDSRKYLQKFIQFELTLNAGSFQKKFDRRFERFSAYFSADDSVFGDEAAIFKDAILQGLDMRRRIALVNRCEIIHRIFNGKEVNQKYNTDYLCAELFLSLLHDSRFSQYAAKEHFKKITDSMSAGTEEKRELFPPDIFEPRNQSSVLPEGLLWMEKECQTYHYDFLSHPISVDSLIGCLYAIYAIILGFQNKLSGKHAYTYSKDLIDFGLEFWKLLNTIS